MRQSLFRDRRTTRQNDRHLLWLRSDEQHHIVLSVGKLVRIETPLSGHSSDRCPWELG